VIVLAVAIDQIQQLLQKRRDLKRAAASNPPAGPAPTPGSTGADAALAGTR
jgi:erythritol transport system permease protein